MISMINVEAGLFGQMPGIADKSLWHIMPWR